MCASVRASLPRKAKTNVAYSSHDSWQPGLSVSSPNHQIIERLNLESFNDDLYALADDLLCLTLFGSKRSALRWNDYIPEASSTVVDVRNASAQRDFRRAAGICYALTNSALVGDISAVIDDVLKPLQSVSIFRRGEFEWPLILKHLLLRYTIMYQPGSPVKHCKVQYNGSMGLGLKATRDLHPGTFLAETCSSMSRTRVTTAGPSIIEGQSKQLGPTGPRLIVGPFRFANHACDANCRIFPVPNTNAYVIVVESMIQMGDEITVKYGQHGYYDQQCLCATCTGVDTTVIRNPKRSRVPGGDEVEVGTKRKKIRRSLKAMRTIVT